MPDGTSVARPSAKASRNRVGLASIQIALGHGCRLSARHIELDGVNLFSLFLTKQLVVHVTLTGGLLTFSAGATNCGGRVETDAAQDHTGGQPYNTGIASSTNGSLDAGVAADVGICSAPPGVCCPWSSVSTQGMANCVIPITAPVPPRFEFLLSFNCMAQWIPPMPDAIDAGAPMSDSWIVDNIEQPTRIILGASLCEQIKSQGFLSVYLVETCLCIT